MFSPNDIANFLLKTLADMKGELSTLQSQFAANLEQQKRDRDDIEYLKDELSKKASESEIVTKGQLSELKANIATWLLVFFGGSVAIEIVLKVLGL